MQSWLGKKLVDFQLRALRERGDVRPVVLLDAPDIEMTFPGENSWSGAFRGKAAHRAWLERFVASGIQIFADEVVVTGWPWRNTICIRGTDHLDDAAGDRVYENRWVIWGHLRWGRLHRYEIYEDTEKATALDGWMERVGHPAARTGALRRAA